MIADIARRLADRGIYVKAERGTHRTACPECKHGRNDTALSVTIDEGGAVWNCFRCQWKGASGRPSGTRDQNDDGHEQVARKAEEILKAGHYVGGAHPYLKRKGIKSHGLKVDHLNRLIIPMSDMDGKLWNVQTIAPNGDKRFLKGGRKKGCLFSLGVSGASQQERGRFVIAEGFATAASILEAVNTVTVIVAFDCGNLEPVARAVRKEYPDAPIVIAADDDYETEGNPGLTKARAVAELIGAAIAVPEFPANGTRGTDFNDLHVKHGYDAVHKIIHDALDTNPEPRQPPPEPEPEQRAARFIDLSARGATRFTGPPPQIQWLVQHSIPLGVPVVLAAMGGVGKSFLTLQLCHQVASRPIEKPEGASDQLHNLSTFANPLLGGTVATHGKAVFITSEDSEDVIHRRLAVVDPEGRRTDDLIIVSLPSDGGPLPLFVQDHNGVRTTPEWHMIRSQLVSMTGLRLIAFDPIAAFAQVSLDNDSAAVQFIMSAFSQLAAETGATVLLCHHMRKPSGDKPITTAAQARGEIKGVSQMVDGARLAYALWPMEKDAAEKVCKDLGLPIDSRRVFQGGIVKTNEIDGDLSTYVRGDGGLLRDVTGALLNARTKRDDLLDLLEADLAWHAADEMPLQHTGKGSDVYECRECLHPDLSTLGRNYLQALCKELIDTGRIVKCRASGSSEAKWLDVPNGPYTRTNGEGEIRFGARGNRHTK
jgi:hypothetical protein